MPLDDRPEVPSGPPEVGTVALLVSAGAAVLAVTAALARYVAGRAAASARDAWGRRRTRGRTPAAPRR
jgi:hypothetical protein